MNAHSSDLLGASAPQTAASRQVLLWLPPNQPPTGSFDREGIRPVDSLADLRSALGSTEASRILMHLDLLTAPKTGPIINEIKGIGVKASLGIIARKTDFPKALALAIKCDIGMIVPEHTGDFMPEGLGWPDWLNPDPLPDPFASSFDPEARRHTIEVRNCQDKELVGQVFDQLFGAENGRTTEYHDGRLVLEEMLNNAVFHAFVNKKGQEKYAPGQFTEIQSHEKITIKLLVDSNQVVLSVFDNGGRLDRKTILHQIRRRMLSHGLFDKSGRGLYLTYALPHRLMVQLIPGRQTELIAFFSRHSRSTNGGQEPKPILINEHTT